MKGIDPTLEAHRDKPLWCVYGTRAFPSIFCCKITNHSEFGLVIWGYSVWKNQPGFRTIGRSLAIWSSEHDLSEFYTAIDGALEALRLLITPHFSMTTKHEAKQCQL